jgi:hypothetical protein
VPVPTIAVGNPSFITCAQNPVLLNYTGVTGGSGIPGAVAIVTSWQGPAPQASVSGVATYTAYVAGVYTLTVQDNMNGCYGSAMKVVPDQTQPPAGAASYSNTCGGTITVTPTFTGSTSNLSFLWTAPTSGTIVGANNTMNVNVTGFGTYSLTITNNSTQCSRVDTVQVYSCPGIKKNSNETLSLKLYPNPASKNLTVSFEQAPYQTQIEIFDLQGKLMFTEILNQKTTQLNLNLVKGFYIVKVSSEGTTIKTEKLLIE